MCHQVFANLNIQQAQNTLTFIWSCVCVHLLDVSPIITLLLALFWSPLTIQKNIGSLAANCSIYFTSLSLTFCVNPAVLDG